MTFAAGRLRGHLVVLHSYAPGQASTVNHPNLLTILRWNTSRTKDQKVEWRRLIRWMIRLSCKEQIEQSRSLELHRFPSWIQGYPTAESPRTSSQHTRTWNQLRPIYNANQVILHIPLAGHIRQGSRCHQIRHTISSLQSNMSGKRYWPVQRQVWIAQLSKHCRH